MFDVRKCLVSSMNILVSVCNCPKADVPVFHSDQFWFSSPDFQAFMYIFFGLKSKTFTVTKITFLQLQVFLEYVDKWLKL